MVLVFCKNVYYIKRGDENVGTNDSIWVDCEFVSFYFDAHVDVMLSLINKVWIKTLIVIGFLF